MSGRILRLPPVLFLLAVAGASILQVLVPRSLGMPSFATGMTTGAVVMIVAVVIAGWALTAMRRHRTTIEPGQRPSSLVTSGAFAFTRNPLYLSLLLVVVALALMTDGLWFVVAAVVLWLVLSRVVIRQEERLLEEIFDREYADYKRHVRRWL